jgi:hypothetical protein
LRVGKEDGLTHAVHHHSGSLQRIGQHGSARQTLIQLTGGQGLQEGERAGGAWTDGLTVYNEKQKHNAPRLHRKAQRRAAHNGTSPGTRALTKHRETHEKG